MLINRLTCLILLLAFGAPSFGQQLSLFNKYRENATQINPAALESDYLAFGYDLTVGANYRRQWTGLDATPETQSARISYVQDRNSAVRLMAGGSVINDRTGPTGYAGAYARVGMLIGNDPEEAGISVGLAAGYAGYRVRVSDFVVRDEDDVLLGADRSQGYPDVGLGVYGYSYLNNDHMVYGGVSLPQVLGFDVTFQDENGDFSIQRMRHYYAMAGWYWFTGQDTYLELSSWLKYVDGAPLNADLSARFQLPTAPYIGAGISTAGFFHLEAGVNVGQSQGDYTNFRVGYAFAYSFATFGPSVGGTHEIQVAFSVDR